MYITPISAGFWGGLENGNRKTQSWILIPIFAMLM